MDIKKIKTQELESFINIIQMVIDDKTRKFSVYQNNPTFYQQQLKEIHDDLNYYTSIREKMINETIIRIKEITWDSSAK